MINECLLHYFWRDAEPKSSKMYLSKEILSFHLMLYSFIMITLKTLNVFNPDCFLVRWRRNAIYINNTKLFLKSVFSNMCLNFWPPHKGNLPFSCTDYCLTTVSFNLEIKFGLKFQNLTKHRSNANFKWSCPSFTCRLMMSASQLVISSMMPFFRYSQLRAQDGQ